MKIVFFGTPDFAVPSLEKLNESNHEILAVVTAPDKPKGRGRNIAVTPIKQFALDNKIPVITPVSLKDEGLGETLKSLNPDLFVVVAFRILPRSIFSIPKFGSFNLHGSLLPKYRGAAPIQWAIINGDTKTGLTTFFLEEKVDTGNIILMEELEINKNDNLGTLHDKMSEKGAELILKTVNLIEEGDFTLEMQDNELATPAPKIKKETCRIDWTKSAFNIHNLIRGLSPYPGAFFEKDNKIFKVYSSNPSDITGLLPSQIRQTKNQIFIGTSTEALEILEIQPEGRKRMKTEDFLRGYSLT